MDIKDNFISNNITSINTNFFLKFIISVSGMILGILSFLVVLGSFTALIQKDATKFESKNRYVFIYFGLVKKVVRQLDF